MESTRHPAGARPWVMRQTWNDLLFAHWPLPPEQIAALLPPGLTLDTFDGKAWLGVVPFWMSGIRWRGLPGVPGTMSFPEINVRTYVRAGAQAGVYFFSLDAGNALAVRLARAAFFLPYWTARFTLRHAGQTIDYHSARVNSAAPGEFAATYQPTGPVFRAQPGTLEYWLTERYAFLTPGPGGHIYQGAIRHDPWPLQPATATITRNTLPAAGLTLPEQTPLLHFARQLKVVCWFIRRVDESGAVTP